MVVFRENLKKLRKELGLTQEKIAIEIGISHKYYSEIERGLSDPSIKIIYNIAIKYKVNLNWLLLGIGTKNLTDNDIIVG